MTYHIKSIFLLNFIDGSIKIELPRFQRKSTWNEEQKFQLAISVFKNYPAGVVILFNDNQGSRPVKFLLDGRQRRETLYDLYYESDKLYNWAKKKYYKAGMEYGEFYEKIIDAINEENNEDKNIVDEDNNGDDMGSDTECEAVDGKDFVSKMFNFLNVVSEKSGKGLHYVFDFFKFGKNTDQYIREVNKEKRNVDTKELFNFLRIFIMKTGKYSAQITEEDFIEALKLTVDFKDKSEFNSSIDQKWSKIKSVLDFIEIINDAYTKNNLAMIELENIETVDSQKIFELINTGGTQLKAGEILSAKAAWNVPLSIENDEMKRCIKKLYTEKMGMSPKENEYVKWDFPASLYWVLEENLGGIISYGDAKNDKLSEKITFGFKLLAGIYCRGVKKGDFDLLVDKKNPSNIMDGDIFTSKTITDLKDFFSVLSQNEYIAIFRSWNKDIMSIMSEAPAIAFILMLFKKWKDLDRPTPMSNVKKFNNHVIALLDKFFYEYISLQWKGSSDAKIGRHITEIEKNDAPFEPRENSEWEKIITDIIDDNKIWGILIDENTAKNSIYPIVYYYSLLKKIRGKKEEVNIDHICPKEEWESVRHSDKVAIMNNLYNLALLPESLNKGKKERTLLELKIGNKSLNDVLYYEEVDDSEIETFSKPENWEKMKEIRGKLFKEAFIDSEGKESIRTRTLTW